MNKERTWFSILGAVGGSGVIIVGLSAWIGQLMASSIEASTKAKYEKELVVLQSEYDKEIVSLKSSLEESRSRKKRTSDARFGLYREVWSQLMDLKSAGDRLWENASKQNLETFIALLDKAKLATNRGRLILREEHYQQLQQAFLRFKDYEIGKNRLVELRSPEMLRELYQDFNADDITHQIAANASAKRDYEQITQDILWEFRQQLGLATW